MTDGAIRYPVARAQDGAAVHIDDWERGQDVTCFGCGKPLVGRLPHDGIKPTAHFAHKAELACSGETALHRAAKAAIVRSHARGALQFLAWGCPRCKRQLHRTDLRALVLREEDRPCDGVVSDVLARDADGAPRVAIEVVVTHDLEVATLERCRALGFRVFSLQPNWGVVGDLARGADLLCVTHRAGDVDAASCGGCQQLLREKLEWEDRERRRRAAAWWSAWCAAWLRVGREEVARAEEARLALAREQRARETWWHAWARVWRLIGDRQIAAWWSTWDVLWRAVGAEHARPHIWGRRWCAAWAEIGERRAADAAEETRRLVEAAIHANVARHSWWSAWTRMWSDIAQRESGLRAAWHPICRNCRQDLAPGHRCP